MIKFEIHKKARRTVVTVDGVDYQIEKLGKMLEYQCPYCNEISSAYSEKIREIGGGFCGSCGEIFDVEIQ